MKHTVRAFAVGLITSGLILLGVFYFLDESNQRIQDYTTEELITLLEDEGLRAVSEEEYISYSVDDTKENTEENDSKDNDSDKESNQVETKNKDSNNEKEAEKEEEPEEDEEEDTPSTITITVEPGMASSHISDLLEEEGLIDDAGEFSDYLLDNDYSLYVRMGDHELETGMSHYEIAEALTN